jgi:hypothetical protein
VKQIVKAWKKSDGKEQKKDRQAETENEKRRFENNK